MLSRKELGRSVIGKGGFCTVFLLPDKQTVARLRKQRFKTNSEDLRKEEKTLESVLELHNELHDFFNGEGFTKPLGLVRVPVRRGIEQLAYLETLAPGVDAFEHGGAVEKIEDFETFTVSVVRGVSKILIDLQDYFAPRGEFYHDDLRLENLVYNPESGSVTLIDLDRATIGGEKRPCTVIIFQYPVVHKKGKLSGFEEVCARVRHSKASDMQTLLLSLWSSVVSFCARLNLEPLEAMRAVSSLATAIMPDRNTNPVSDRADLCDPRILYARFEKK